MPDGARDTYERHVGGVDCLEAGLVEEKQDWWASEFCKAQSRWAQHKNAKICRLLGSRTMDIRDTANKDLQAVPHRNTRSILANKIYMSETDSSQI